MTSTKQILAGLAIGALLMGIGILCLSRPVSPYEVDWIQVFGYLPLGTGLSIVGGICVYLGWYVAGGAWEDAKKDRERKNQTSLVKKT